MDKKAVVVHSGGMDSSICLAYAVSLHGSENVLSMSFDYGQRHEFEISQAKKIAKHFGCDHIVLPIHFLSKITKNALVDKSLEIKHEKGSVPNTLVAGRNGLMARIASIHANSLGAHEVYMGIIEVEEANSGYRDCSRSYMDLIEKALKIDFSDQEFKIVTPLVFMTKFETMEFAHKLGVLEYLLEETITCYNGKPKIGCNTCPACLLRNEGIRKFLKLHPGISFSYKEEI